MDERKSMRKSDESGRGSNKLRDILKWKIERSGRGTERKKV